MKIHKLNLENYYRNVIDSAIAVLSHLPEAVFAGRPTFNNALLRFNDGEAPVLMLPKWSDITIDLSQHKPSWAPASLTGTIKVSITPSVVGVEASEDETSLGSFDVYGVTGTSTGKQYEVTEGKYAIEYAVSILDGEDNPVVVFSNGQALKVSMVKDADNGPDTTLDIASGGGSFTQEQADWSQSDDTAVDYIKNKPTIPAAPVNADWNAESGLAQILNKPTIPTVNNATLTLTQGTTTLGTFTANASTDVTVDIPAGGGGDLLVEKTWSELKAMRDGGTLVPGQQYRITDYVGTTSLSGSSSASHPFDIIVTATSANKLDEVAKAVQHSGDTYFNHSKLDVWKLWYCLDNDGTRFNWAITSTITISSAAYYRSESDDVSGASYPYCWRYGTRLRFTDTATPEANATAYDTSDGTGTSYTITAVSLSDGSGRGVVYHMIDEWGNDAPFDFKGIKPTTNGFLFGDTTTDNSVDGTGSTNMSLFGNTIMSTLDTLWGPSWGNRVARYKLTTLNLANNSVYNNQFGHGCTGYIKCSAYGNVFGNECTFSVDLSNNGNIRLNVFGNSNTITASSTGGSGGSSACANNQIGNGNTLTLAAKCAMEGNVIGNNNTITAGSSTGNGFKYNRIGNNNTTLTISNGMNNTIGNGTTSCIIEGGKNTIGNACGSITINSNASYNSFGDGCTNITLLGNSDQNTFGSRCRYISFGDGTTNKDYYYFITIEPGVQYVNLNCTTATSYSALYKNVKVCSGVSGLTISDSNVGQAYQTVFFKETDGTLKKQEGTTITTVA